MKTSQYFAAQPVAFNTYFRVAAAAALCLTFGIATMANGRTLDAIIDRVDAQTATEYRKDNIGSVTVGIVSEGVLKWTKSYGAADMERRIPATANTVYRIGSVTKQFTALMLLQLVEAGKVRLSDPVEKYFPEFKTVPNAYADSPPVSLIQLATHTSGLDREPDDENVSSIGAVSEWEKILTKALPHTKFAYEPGTQFSYSNVGYAILGAALSHAAHQSYVSYVQERILSPLAMKDTFFEPNDRTRPRIAKGYLIEKDRIDTSITEAQHLGRGYRVPNGALYTTVGDLAKFVAFEMGSPSGKVLKKESIEALGKRIVMSDSEWNDGYGIGYMVKRIGASVVYGHTGSAAAFQTDAFFSKKSHIGIIILRSVRAGNFNSNNILSTAFDE